MTVSSTATSQGPELFGLFDALFGEPSVTLAIGETVILLHPLPPPSPFSRLF